MPPIDDHCIEQTISGIRRKLGETGKHARLLLTRRGLGYGIFPAVTTLVASG
jgi:DNA-binding response OmpR family regulator